MLYLSQDQGHGKRLRRSTFNASLSSGSGETLPAGPGKRDLNTEAFKEKYLQMQIYPPEMARHPPQVQTVAQPGLTKYDYLCLSIFPHPVQVVI